MRPFKTLTFTVAFVHDPDRLFRGRADAALSPDGLRVRLRSRREFWVPSHAAHAARYLGGNRLAVVLDGRPVVLAVVKQFADLNRLAQDTVAFLNGARDGLEMKDYRLPWKLSLLPWLAVVIPFAAMGLRVLGGVSGGGRFLWFLMAALAVFLGIRRMRRETLSTGRRFAAAGAVLGGFFLVLIGAFAYRLANPNTVPRSRRGPPSRYRGSGTACSCRAPLTPPTRGSPASITVRSTRPGTNR